MSVLLWEWAVLADYGQSAQDVQRVSASGTMLPNAGIAATRQDEQLAGGRASEIFQGAAAALQDEQRVAAAAIEAFIGTTNLAPNADSLSGWTLSGLTLANGGPNGATDAEYTGTGANAGSNLELKNPAITVVPGQTYTPSWWVDPRFLTHGVIDIRIIDAATGTVLRDTAPIGLAPGSAAQRYAAAPWMCPAGTSSIYMDFFCWNGQSGGFIVANGQKFKISQPALIAAQQDQQTVSAAGALIFRGAAVLRQDDQRTSGNGVNAGYIGPASTRQDDQRVTAAGEGQVPEGPAVTTQDAQTASGAGTLAIRGPGAAAQREARVSASGGLAIPGTASAAQSEQTAIAGGKVTGPNVSGSSAIAQPPQTVAASATEALRGSAGSTQADQTVVGGAAGIYSGRVASAQQPQTVDDAAGVTWAGVGVPVQDGQPVASSGFLVETNRIVLPIEPTIYLSLPIAKGT